MNLHEWQIWSELHLFTPATSWICIKQTGEDVKDPIVAGE